MDCADCEPGDSASPSLLAGVESGAVLEEVRLGVSLSAGGGVVISAYSSMAACCLAS